jgi:hypothetical protein
MKRNQPGGKAGRREERAGQARRPMTTMHALFEAEVECKMTQCQAGLFAHVGV